MSVRKLAAGLITTVLSLGACTTGFAGDHMPELDPFAFDPEFRWFEPVYDIDLEELKPEKRAPSGWFATYDRLNLYGSRPERDFAQTQGGEAKLDGGWGHRYEVGYMTPSKDTGFTFTYTENNINAAETVENNGFDLSEFGQDLVVIPINVLDTVVTADIFGNFDPIVFEDLETLNYLSYDSYELNKTWRMTPYHYGGILEPLVGARYMSVTDHTAVQDFLIGDSFIRPDAFFLNPADNLVAGRRLTTQQATTENDIFAGQIGFRYMKQKQRFTFSSDFRVFAGASLQYSQFNETEYIQILADTADPDIGALSSADILTGATPTQTERNEEFVVGFDLRGELGYQLTRMVQVRAGFQLIDIGTGVWRGGFGSGRFDGDQDQDVVMVGGTFGISLNH